MLSESSGRVQTKPFLLNFRSEANTVDVPHLTFDEKRSVNVVSESDEPLARTRYLLATQTKTEAAPESDDDNLDVDYHPNDDSMLRTLTKTAAEQENDDSD